LMAQVSPSNVDQSSSRASSAASRDSSFSSTYLLAFVSRL
jgi:hypothetical protein